MLPILYQQIWYPKSGKICKTDKNDALAIVQASLLPDISFIKGKTVEQQQLQSILRLRELVRKTKDSFGQSTQGSAIGV